MVTRPPELHVFASWEGFLAATAAAEASAEAGGAETEKQEQAPRATDDANVFAHYLLPPLRLVAHPHTESTLPQLLVSVPAFIRLLLLHMSCGILNSGSLSSSGLFRAAQACW